MAVPDYYRALGIKESASPDEVKSAFRRLARECHPDRCNDPVAQRQFKEISEAHTVLSDPDKRRQYDQLRRNPIPKSPPKGKTQPEGTPKSGGFASFVGSILNTFARPTTAGAKGAQSRDLNAEIRIPFLVAARGGRQALTIKREMACDRCSGKGAEPETPVATCPTCRGKGEVVFDQGSFGINRVCHHCRGRGVIPKVACRKCHGSGVLATERTITILIPPAIESGTRLRIQGEGDPGNGSKPNGDLYVTVHVNDHSQWERRGTDIHSDLDITLAQAILGTTIAVESIDGLVNLRIPEGTQPETLFRMRGHGMKKSATGDDRGDHFVRVHVKIPRDLSDDAKKKIEKVLKSIGGQ